MSKSVIKRHRVKLHSPEWYVFRNSGIGASEVASVLAIESELLAELVHTPPIKLFLLKVGEPVQEFTGNQASEAGKYQESGIINLLRYYDFENPDGYETYKRANDPKVKPLRKVLQPKHYYTNSRYPHLFCSPDGIEYRGGKMFAYAEGKLTNSMEAGRYPYRVSPAFILQCYQNMMILELETAYLCILVDGIFFEVITLKADQKIFEQIELATAKFWANVLQARILKESHGLQSYFNVNPAFLSDDQMVAIDTLHSLEPSITGTKEELEFIREICKPKEEFSEMIGTEEQRQLCIDYLKSGEKAKSVVKEKNLITSNLILSLTGTHVANFTDEEGKSIHFSYKPNKNGTPSIYVSPKFLKEEVTAE